MGSTRILLTSYHFPPSAAVGGLRIARFARLLPEYGWEPYVIAVRDEDRDPEEGTDLTRLAGLEATPIERTRAPKGIAARYGSVKSQFRRAAPAPAAEGQRPGGRTGTHDGDVRETLVHRLKRYVVSLVVRLPDEQKNWSLLAIPSAIHLIRKHRIEWILTSGPPFSVHLIGLFASLFTNARWVADFRDPWIEMLTERDPATRSWLSDRLEEWMEATVLNRADRVLTTTARIRGSMMARHPSLPEHKFAYLPNGIDVRLVAAHTEKFERLTITYAGTLYFDRTPEPLFQAFSELVREGCATQTELCIKLVGNCRQIAGVNTLELAQRYGIGSAVEVIDRVPHAEAIRIMQRSHLLLVLAPTNHDLVLPAKIFDYLGSGSKILALAGDGATADLITETGAGACFSPSDVAGLKQYFQGLLEGQQYRDLGNEPGSFARYDARSLTGQLVAELSRAAAPASSVPQGT